MLLEPLVEPLRPSGARARRATRLERARARRGSRRRRGGGDPRAERSPRRALAECVPDPGTTATRRADQPDEVLVRQRSGPAASSTMFVVAGAGLDGDPGGVVHRHRLHLVAAARRGRGRRGRGGAPQATLLTRMSSGPNTSVGRTIACERPEPRAAPPGLGLSAEVREGRVEPRVRDADVDDRGARPPRAPHRKAGEVFATAPCERRLASLEAHPVGVVEGVRPREALEERLVERERRRFDPCRRAGETEARRRVSVRTRRPRASSASAM